MKFKIDKVSNYYNDGYLFFLYKDVGSFFPWYRVGAYKTLEDAEKAAKRQLPYVYETVKKFEL